MVKNLKNINNDIDIPKKINIQYLKLKNIMIIYKIHILNH